MSDEKPESTDEEITDEQLDDASGGRLDPAERKPRRSPSELRDRGLRDKGTSGLRDRD